MKKYLMMALAVVAFASCSKSDDVSDANRTQQSDEFANNFVAKYGKPASNHTWGFGTSVSAPAFDFTRAVQANGNEWGTYALVPDVLTEEQINVVTEWFENNQNPKGISINFSDFFVQQVSSSEYGKGMDYLTCGDNDEHINNFNAGDGGTYGNVCWYAQPIPGVDQNLWRKYHADKIEFMVQSSTTRFGYHNSSDHQQYYNYVIIPGSMISPIVADRYFVAFDYQQVKDDGTPIVNLDGYYNDWIVSITPGLYWKDTKRIICEDLGDTDDFDFNDVVFDAYNDYSRNETVIMVQAAGGTLPLTVGGTEVHEALLVDTKDMVNTGLKSVPVAIYRIAGTYSNFNTIPVVVTGTDAKNYTLKSEVGQVPNKIAVDIDYVWTAERQNIEEKYPKFKAYVGDESTSWYK